MFQPTMTRRNWFKSAGLLTSAGMAAAGAAGPGGHPAAEKYPRNLTKEDVDRWMTELSNWGKWGKGDQAVQQATKMLDDNGTLNFVGNVEGRDLVKHMADVAVCDAMVGNVTMKFFEGLAGFIFKLWEKEFRGSLRGKLAYLLMRPSIGRIRTLFDYEKMGASPLLGVKGMVLITHGSAKRRMIEFALDAGAASGRAHIPDLIADAFRGQPRHPGRGV